MARLNDYIKKMAGGEVEIPAPQNDLEKSLASIAESGGGGGGAFIVNMDAQNTLDKTWQEIYDAATGGQVVTVIRRVSAEGQMVYNIMPVLIVASGEGVYMVSVIAFTQGASQVNFGAASADGYPEMIS